MLTSLLNLCVLGFRGRPLARACTGYASPLWLSGLVCHHLTWATPPVTSGEWIWIREAKTCDDKKDDAAGMVMAMSTSPSLASLGLHPEHVSCGKNNEQTSVGRFRLLESRTELGTDRPVIRP